MSQSITVLDGQKGSQAMHPKQKHANLGAKAPNKKPHRRLGGSNMLVLSKEK